MCHSKQLVVLNDIPLTYFPNLWSSVTARKRLFYQYWDSWLFLRVSNGSELSQCNSMACSRSCWHSVQSKASWPHLFWTWYLDLSPSSNYPMPLSWVLPFCPKSKCLHFRTFARESIALSMKEPTNETRIHSHTYRYQFCRKFRGWIDLHLQIGGHSILDWALFNNFTYFWIQIKVNLDSVKNL